LEEEYTITINMKDSLYYGVLFKWNYKAGEVKYLIPKYVFQNVHNHYYVQY
jgi:hypothetical protein